METLTPGIFWYWNANPTPGGIRRQLTAMREAGFRCVYLHPMPDDYHKDFFFQGMEIPYLGKRFFALARVMLAECRRLGLTMMLYDEGGWPSGSVVDTLVKVHPEDRVRALIREGDGYREIRLEIPDLTNPAVTDHFLQMVYERYAEELGEAFGKEIRGIFTDEPFWECYLPKDAIAVPPGLREELRRRHGLEFDGILPLLFPGNPPSEEGRRARWCYVDACTRLFAKNYSRRISDWCHRHRLEFEGHFLYEDLFFRTGFFNDFPRILDPMDVPGVDAIFRQIYPGEGRRFPSKNPGYPECGSGQYARFAQCAAIRNHRHEAFCECFNVYGYAMTTGVMFYVANSLAVKGINRILIMPYLYSDRGKRKICCSTDYSPRHPLWRHLRPLNEYLSWLGQFDAGALDPEVRVLAVTECFEGEDIHHPLPAAKEYADAVDAMLERLDDALVFWRFTTPDELTGENPPRVLVLPGPCRIPEVQAKVARLEAAGVTVVDGFAVTDFRSYADLEVEQPMKQVKLLAGQRGEGRVRLLFNASSEVKRLRFRSETAFRELPPPDDIPGTLSPLQYVEGIYELSLEPGNLRILVESETPPETLPAPVWERRLELAWRLVRVERLRYAKLAPSRYETIKETRPLPASGLYTDLEPDFSGTVVLAAQFDSTEAFDGLLLFDRICYGGELRVNRRRCGVRAFAPWGYRIRVQRGENHIELRINSSAGNEWSRCFREELKPAGWFNDYVKEIEGFSRDAADCGAAPGATLFRLSH
ncbi:MAG: hypothetical protein ACI4SG_01755 [Oligosphaeraceae bacterium]